MAGITRATAQLFSTTGLTGTGGFGAAANGTTTTEAGSSNSVANIQTGTSGAWAGGWLSAVLGASKFPAVEDMNAVNNVFSTQIAYILERGIPEYDAGTTYAANDIVRGVGLTTLYASVGSNVGNSLSNPTYWTFLCDLANLATNVFTGGTTTGSANAQTLASVSPAAGLTPSNGQTVIFTAGYTNTGSATLAVTAPSISATAIKKDSGSGLVNLAAGDITVGDTIYVSWNSTSSVWVLTSGLALGALAYLGIGTGLASSGGNINNTGFVTLNTQIITSTGTYTPTAGMVYCKARGVGGGGAGGGVATSGTQTGAAAGGGSSGAYGEAVFTAAVIGASQTVTIGAAGAAGSAGNNPGGNGGQTSLGTLLICPGGTGGSGSAAGSGAAGAGGAAASAATASGNTGALVALNPPGGNGFGVGATGNLGFGVGGQGGSNPLGTGGSFGVATSTSSVAGNPGTGYGAGGSGAANADATQQAGGVGTKGVIIIDEYCHA